MAQTMPATAPDRAGPAPAAEAGARMMMLRRDGAPPLKLRATVAGRWSARRGGVVADIALLARTVGWAVAVTVEGVGARARADARSVDTLEDAADFLQSLLARKPAVASVGRGPAALVVAARLTARLRAVQATQALALAAGAALTDWSAPGSADWLSEGAAALSAPQD